MRERVRGGWTVVLLVGLIIMPGQARAQEPPRQLDVEELAIIVNRLREARTQCENENASLWKALGARDRQLVEVRKQIDEKAKVPHREPEKP